MRHITHGYLGIFIDIQRTTLNEGFINSFIRSMIIFKGVVWTMVLSSYFTLSSTGNFRQEISRSLEGCLNSVCGHGIQKVCAKICGLHRLRVFEMLFDFGHNRSNSM